MRSAVTGLSCGVLQGSVFGPVLFITYTADLVPGVVKYSLYVHLYADDTQIYGFCPPSGIMFKRP